MQKEINCRKNVARLTGELVGLTLAKNIVEDLPEEPQFNENQQIVLEYLKKMCPPKLDASAMVTVYCLVDDNINDNWQVYSRVKELDRVLERKVNTLSPNEYKMLADERDRTFALMDRYSKN